MRVKYLPPEAALWREQASLGKGDDKPQNVVSIAEFVARNQEGRR